MFNLSSSALSPALSSAYGGEGGALTVDHPHRAFRIASAGGDSHGGDFVDAAEVVAAQFHVGGAGVFFEIRAALGPGDRHDVLASGHHPRERQLRGRAAFRTRNFADVFDEVEVSPEVFALKPRRRPA